MQVSVPSKAEILSTREKKLVPSLVTHFKDPVYITQGQMQYLFDNEGKK